MYWSCSVKNYYDVKLISMLSTGAWCYYAIKISKSLFVYRPLHVGQLLRWLTHLHVHAHNIIVVSAHTMYQMECGGRGGCVCSIISQYLEHWQWLNLITWIQFPGFLFLPSIEVTCTYALVQWWSQLFFVTYSCLLVKMVLLVLYWSTLLLTDLLPSW